MVDKMERIYTVPLGKAYDYVRTKRTPRAVKILRQFIARHMKAKEMPIVISTALNAHLWEHSIQRPPRKVKVRLIKDAGKVNAYLADEKITEKKPVKEEKKDAKKEEPKKAEEKTGEKKKEEPKKVDEKKSEAKKEEPKKVEEKKPEVKKEAPKPVEKKVEKPEPAKKVEEKK